MPNSRAKLGSATAIIVELSGTRTDARAIPMTVVVEAVAMEAVAVEAVAVEAVSAKGACSVIREW